MYVQSFSIQRLLPPLSELERSRLIIWLAKNLILNEVRTLSSNHQPSVQPQTAALRTPAN